MNIAWKKNHQFHAFHCRGGRKEKFSIYSIGHLVAAEHSKISMNALQKCEEDKNQPKNVFEINFTDNSVPSSMKYLQTVLSVNSLALSSSELFKDYIDEYSTNMRKVANFVNTSMPDLGKHSNVRMDDSDLEFIFQRRHISFILDNGMFLRQNNDGRQTGFGLYLVSALMSRSCETANVQIINVDNKSVMVLLRPIKKGQQLITKKFNLFYERHNNKISLRTECLCEKCKDVRPDNLIIRTKVEDKEKNISALKKMFEQINRLCSIQDTEDSIKNLYILDRACYTLLKIVSLYDSFFY